MAQILQMKAVAARTMVEAFDPRLASVFDFFEHHSPALHPIHDEESCPYCKNPSLVRDPNEFSDIPNARQVLALTYNPRKSMLAEKETGILYELMVGSARHRLLSLLIRNRTYVPTKVLALTGAGDVSRAIQKINLLFARKFGVQQKLIVGKTGKGYRINPKIRLLSEGNNP